MARALSALSSGIIAPAWSVLGCGTAVADGPAAAPEVALKGGCYSARRAARWARRFGHSSARIEHIAESRTRRDAHAAWLAEDIAALDHAVVVLIILVEPLVEHGT
jgi:hypothetical protein